MFGSIAQKLTPAELSADPGIHIGIRVPCHIAAILPPLMIQG
jgi:hypothetical protein